jgi:hypothetical protein
MPTDQRIFDQLVDLFVQHGSDRNRVHDHTPITGSSFMGYQGGRLSNLLDDINDWFLPSPEITASEVKKNNTAESLADLIEDREGRAH